MTVPHPERVGESGTPARAPARTPSPWHGQGPVVAAVSIGGVIGATARYGAGLLWPTPDGAFPWTTFTINVVGCATIGVLMAVITELPAVHRLVRPFLGTGVLGGFTTFSTYAVDIRNLIGGGHPGTALVYLVATLSAALTAVWLGTAAARRALAWRQR
ncbi:fluoride efflux transporter CrcB [Streptomyces sp. NPDC002667]|uniref:fluoride efflux transporter CrcB n=1 Tax=Streptomyces sp. NPDC002667 TaxID=3364657 RepID=UPI00369FDF18